MTSAPGQMPSRHSLYEPFPWIFWVRIAQLVLTVLVIILAAYGTSQSLLGWGASFSFFTISWSIVWVPLVTWGVPRIPANYRPNIIVLIFECCSWFWWFLTFVGLALLSSAYSLLDGSAYGFKRSTTVDPTDPSYYSYNTSTGSYSSGSSSSSSSTSTSKALGDYYDKLTGGANAIKAATAFAAINWVLFLTTFIAICVKIHRQRKERLQEIYQAGGNPNVTINNIHVHGAAVETDKQPQVNVAMQNV